MIEVTINTFGTVSKAAGWSNREVYINQDKANIEDALNVAKLANGGSLQELISDVCLLRDNFAIFLNGYLLDHPTDLRKEINNGDKLHILDYPFTLGGG